MGQAQYIFKDRPVAQALWTLVLGAMDTGYKEEIIMAKFETFQQSVPTKVKKIEIQLTSILKPVHEVIDGETVVVGEEEVEALVAFADVEDQDGNIIWNHSADYQELLNMGLLTAQQLQIIQTWLQDFRDGVEAKVLA
jgi:hypothetical protein